MPRYSRSFNLFAVIGLSMLSPARGQGINFAGLLDNDPQLANFASLLGQAGISPSEGKTVFAPPQMPSQL